LREGVGTLHFATGDRYVGLWVAGKMEGQGTFHFATGDRYEGEYVAGHMEGQGTMHYAGGNRYEGEFVADKMAGQGTMHFADGDRYEGEFVADQMEGQGTYHFANGEVAVSCFKGGAPVVGEGVMWSAERATAWRVASGGVKGEPISLEEAARIAERVGLPVPGA